MINNPEHININDELVDYNKENLDNECMEIAEKIGIPFDHMLKAMKKGLYKIPDILEYSASLNTQHSD